MNSLTRNEELILLSIWKLKDEAYGISIRKHLVETARLGLHYGSLYNSLYKLVKKGLVSTAKSAPQPQKGGRSKVLYHLTDLGREALREAQRIHRSVWRDIPELAFEGDSD